MFTKLQRTIIFLGDFWPLFLIGLLEGWQSINWVDIILFSVLLLFSIIGTSYLHYLLKDTKRFQSITRTVNSIEDRGNVYVIYIVSYVSLIPILSQTIAGTISFLIILIIIYSLYMNSDMVFYNPYLALKGYKFYKVQVQEEDEIYVISKKSLTKNEPLKMYMLTDYVYIYISPD